MNTTTELSSILRRTLDQANPGVVGLAVEHVLGMLAAGDTPQRLLQEYPFLEAADIQACLAYAHRSLSGEQVQERIAGAKVS
jgi:hypothetical protein